MDAIEELIAEHCSYSDKMVEFKGRCDHLNQGDYGGLIRMKKNLYSLKLAMDFILPRKSMPSFRTWNIPSSNP